MKIQRLPGSLMKGGIPGNGCLTQWRRRWRKKKEEKIPVSSSKALFRFSYYYVYESQLFYITSAYYNKHLYIHTYTHTLFMHADTETTTILYNHTDLPTTLHLLWACINNRGMLTTRSSFSDTPSSSLMASGSCSTHNKNNKHQQT